MQTMRERIESMSKQQLAEWTDEQVEAARKGILMECGVIDPTLFSIPEMPEIPKPPEVAISTIKISVPDDAEYYFSAKEGLGLLPNHPLKEEALNHLLAAIATGAVILIEREWISNFSGTVNKFAQAASLTSGTCSGVSPEDIKRWSDATATARSRRDEIKKLIEERDRTRKEAEKVTEWFFRLLEEARTEKLRADKALAVWKEYLSLSGGHQKTAYRFFVAALGERAVEEACEWHSIVAAAREAANQPNEQGEA